MTINVTHFCTLFIFIFVQITVGYEIKHNENVTKENRIIGGQSAEEKQYPWHAAIAVQKNDTLALCGGSLISRQWILTSAQCIDGGEIFSVGLGKTNLDDYETNKLLVTTKSIIHENYDKLTLQYDIGLIKLPKVVVFSERINATRLPSRHLSEQQLDNLSVNISGHGRNIYDDISTNLTSIEAQIVTLQRCIDFYGRESININFICATVNAGEGPCFNDTGDPLIMYESDSYATQIGIFSYFHDEGCNLGYPSVYTKVGRYIDWIHNKTGIEIIEDDNNASNSLQITNIILILSTIFLIQNITVQK